MLHQPSTSSVPLREDGHPRSSHHQPETAEQSGYLIRPARLGDIEPLVAIETAVFETDRISRRSFRNLIASPSAVVLVVEAAGTGDGTVVSTKAAAPRLASDTPRSGPILAYAALLVRRGTGLARLYSIAVSAHAAGRGVGRALLKAAEAAAFARDRIALRLEVRADNAAAIALYRGEGFRPIGTYLDYYADHETALRFEKTLRGDHPIDTGVPYYEQTTDFTCGACCLMMAMGRDIPGFVLEPVTEIRLWREATTIFMMSGPGGCEPYGLAVAAHEAGLAAEIHVS
ncbi:MAG: peptidase C39 family protein, partial [Aurantimonas coralicida]|nr:peptidase C39 family protein [Aurantimonas coralicida]